MATVALQHLDTLREFLPATLAIFSYTPKGRS
jgi:hypothetical protein